MFGGLCKLLGLYLGKLPAVLAGNLFIVASRTEASGPCGHARGFFEKVNFVAVIQPIFAGTYSARLFPTWLCALMGFAHPFVGGAW